MPLNYPANPELNQLYVFNGVRWRWNGYAWISAGVCGSNQASTGQGISGDYVSSILGGAGVTVSSITGDVEISLRLNEPGISDTSTSEFHTSPSTISGESGYARKAAFLQDDGSITFDFIKTYDIFRQSEFLFDILSFNIVSDANGNIQLNPQLASSGANFLNLGAYRANITYRQTPVSGKIDIINASNTNKSENFPAALSDLNLFNFDGTHFVRYKEPTNNPSNDYWRFQIGVTGENSDGTLSYKTRNYDLFFYNNIFYGHSALQTLETNQLQSFLNFQLNATKSFTLNFTVPTNPNPNTPNYVYYAYPARLGEATFLDLNNGFPGGFIKQTNGGNDSFPYTNNNGYTENYFIYRSDNGNLGQINIAVS